MPDFIAEKIFSFLGDRAGNSEKPSILMLGMTFKADIADARNSKAISLARIIAARGATTTVSDPLTVDGLEYATSFRVVDDPFG